MRCLIVDDSRPVRMLSRKMLTEEGHTVEEAEDGQQALDVVTGATEPFDVILLDWNMPRMDGLTCLRELRSLPIAYRPHIIMCTTECDFAHITEAITAGADEYIMKPFTADVLTEKIGMVTSG